MCKPQVEQLYTSHIYSIKNDNNRGTLSEIMYKTSKFYT